MLPDKETTNTEEDMSEDQQDECQLHNASAESDPLDSEQKAASEADTLPIEKKVEGLDVAKSERHICSKNFILQIGSHFLSIPYYYIIWGSIIKFWVILHNFQWK